MQWYTCSRLVTMSCLGWRESWLTTPPTVRSSDCRPFPHTLSTSSASMLSSPIPARPRNNTYLTVQLSKENWGVYLINSKISSLLLGLDFEASVVIECNPSVCKVGVETGEILVPLQRPVTAGQQAAHLQREPLALGYCHQAAGAVSSNK